MTKNIKKEERNRHLFKNLKPIDHKGKTIDGEVGKDDVQTDAHNIKIFKKTSTSKNISTAEKSDSIMNYESGHNSLKNNSENTVSKKSDLKILKNRKNEKFVTNGNKKNKDKENTKDNVKYAKENIKDNVKYAKENTKDNVKYAKENIKDNVKYAKENIKDFENKKNIGNRNEKKVDYDSKNFKKIRIKGNARSNPKYEYNLVDAKGDEKTLILEGGIVDRINCLALLCARNPSVENYKQLLYFANDQRNDIIYLVLKNIRDLLKNKKVDDFYIKTRIVKSFEVAVKNQYIKDKVIEIIGVLIRAGIYEEEFLIILIERLDEKGTALKAIEKEIRSVFFRHKNLIIEHIEDFYYKNDSFRPQHSVLKFLSTIEFTEISIMFDFYNQALTTLDPAYPTEHKDLMMELIINGLNKSYVKDKPIERIDLIRTFISSSKTAIASLLLLKKINDPYLEAFALRAAKSDILRNTIYEAHFLNIINDINSTDLIIKLANTCFYYSVSYILGILMISSSKLIDNSKLVSLHIFIKHYHPFIQKVALKILNNEKIEPFDSFDPILLSEFTKYY